MLYYAVFGLSSFVIALRWSSQTTATGQPQREPSYSEPLAAVWAPGSDLCIPTARNGCSPSEQLRHRGASYSRYFGPRLRHPPQPQGPLGMEIAIEDRDGASLRTLHAALQRAQNGSGQARLLFFGASHVGSDLFTGYLRQQLQQRFGDAGHGFVLPAQPWKSYRHQGIRIDGQRRRWTSQWVHPADERPDFFGLAGVYLESSRPGSLGAVSTVNDSPIGQNADLFDLYYLQQPGGGELDVWVDDHHIGRLSTASDTPQAAYFTHRMHDGPHRLEISTRGDGPVRIFGVSVERSRPGVIVDTLGINGARARYQLQWDESLFREHLQRRRPDLVVLAYGTNESGDDSPLDQYAEQLRQVVGRIRSAAPLASCLLIGPSDRPIRVGKDGFEDRPRTAYINQIQHAVALQYGCGFFDLFAFQGGPLSMLEWTAAQPSMASGDYVHFNRLGYERLGQVLLDALLENYGG